MAGEQPLDARATDVAHDAPESPEHVGEYTSDQMERALYEFESEQNLMLGTVAGAIAGAVGAILWAIVTVITEFQIGLLAVAIGFLVGAAVRWAGRGTTQVFGVVGAILALVSILAGNFLSLLGLLAAGQGIPFLEMAAQFDYSQTFALMAAAFSPIDLLFYGIAVWEGYRFSIREITVDELRARLDGEEGA